MAEETKNDLLPRVEPGSPGSAPPSPVEGSGAQKSVGIAPAPASARSSVPLYGGNRSGKKRADGLAPGSAEALEADRKKDRERKQRIREAAHRQIEAPALPSALASGDRPVAPGSNGLGSTPGAPAGSALSGLAEPAEEIIPWEPEMLQGLFTEALDFSERRRVQKFKEAAQAAQLGDQVVRQIGQDAQYPAAFKVSAGRHGPKAIAKTLNRFGVSAKYSDEGIFAFSVLAIWYQGWRLQASLEELIENSKKERREREKNSAGAPAEKGKS